MLTTVYMTDEEKIIVFCLEFAPQFAVPD